MQLRSSNFQTRFIMKKIACYILFAVFSFANITSAFAEVFEVDLFIKDHKFNPEILELPAGKKIRITVHNQDSTIEEFESTDLKREKIVPGNSKAKVILAPLKPGEYKFFGEFHEETAQGKIVVKEKVEEEPDV